ncbi:MAG TPA: hypothetical protein VMH20_19225 [Verrucomicrobiae bacterium]|nr:hypothetical protein [Verrucomicrobiae bacterium]
MSINRFSILAAAGLLSAGMTCVHAQPAQPQQPAQRSSQPASAQAQTPSDGQALPAGAPIDAALNKSLNSKRAKPGDAVTATVTQNTEANGRIMIPQGTRLEGHVTEASARSKGAPISSLQIVFDKAVLKHGETIPVTVTVQALALSQSEATSQNNTNINMDTMGGVPSSDMNRGMTATQPQPQANPAPHTYSASSNAPNSPAVPASSGAVGGLDARGQLKANSKGVFGLPDIASDNAAAPQESARITSTSKDLHLDGGTQLLLLTRGAANTNQKPQS